MDLRFATEHLRGRWMYVQEGQSPGIALQLARAHENNHFSTKRTYDEFDHFLIDTKGCPCLVAIRHSDREPIMFRMSRLAFARFCDAHGISRMIIRNSVEKAGEAGREYAGELGTQAIHARTSSVPVTFLVRQESDFSYIIREIVRPNDPHEYPMSRLYEELRELDYSGNICQVRFSDYGSSYLLDTANKKIQIEVGTSLAMKTMYVQGIIHWDKNVHLRLPGPHSRKAFKEFQAIHSAIENITPAINTSLDALHPERLPARSARKLLALASRACKQRRTRSHGKDQALAELAYQLYETPEWPEGRYGPTRACLALGKVARRIDDPEIANRLDRACYDILMGDVEDPTQHDHNTAADLIANLGTNVTNYKPKEKMKLEAAK